MKNTELRDLVGFHILSGIEVGSDWFIFDGWGEDCQFVKFTLDGVTYIAVEDPSDGYRSYMRDLQISEDACKIKLPDIAVSCIMDKEPDNDVLIFHDVKNGKEFLSIGTKNYGDYYPYCVFDYKPENMSVNEEKEAEEC